LLARSFSCFAAILIPVKLHLKQKGGRKAQTKGRVRQAKKKEVKKVANMFLAIFGKKKGGKKQWRYGRLKNKGAIYPLGQNTVLAGFFASTRVQM